MSTEMQKSELEQDMVEAVAAEDFETAARLRDQIQSLEPEDEAASGSLLRRQVPGKMGLGTDQQTYIPPKGWVPPTKPDPMTSGRSRGKKG
jgi:hypothetical protein